MASLAQHLTPSQKTIFFQIEADHLGTDGRERRAALSRVFDVDSTKFPPQCCFPSGPGVRTAKCFSVYPHAASRFAGWERSELKAATGWSCSGSHSLKNEEGSNA
jgi:hypothetical protein